VHEVFVQTTQGAQFAVAVEHETVPEFPVGENKAGVVFA